MLSSLLPGLRDLRTPLASGYLWLIGIWLVFRDELPDPSTATGLAKDIIDLLEQLGRPIALAALTFIAYVIGSIALSPFEVVVRFAREAAISAYDAQEGWEFIVGKPGIRLGKTYQRLDTFIDQRVRDLAATYPLASRDYDKVLGRESKDSSLQRVYDGIMDDFDQLTLRLQTNNKDLFEVYDRKRAESEFRFAVAVPLMVIIVTLMVQLEQYWAVILMAVPFALIVQGALRRAEANEQIVEALLQGIIDTPFFERLQAHLERNGKASSFSRVGHARAEPRLDA